MRPTTDENPYEGPQVGMNYELQFTKDESGGGKGGRSVE